MSPGTCITGAYDTSLRGGELCLVADLGPGAGAVRRLASASALVRELKGGKVVAIPENSDPTPAAQRAMGLMWHNGQPSGVVLGRATDLTRLNPAMGYRHASALRLLDGTVEYQVGGAAGSPMSGQGWCVRRHPDRHQGVKELKGVCVHMEQGPAADVCVSGPCCANLHRTAAVGGDMVKIDLRAIQHYKAQDERV
jgi:hypothetical protein